MCSTLQAYKTSTMMQHHATCVLYVPLYRKEKQVSMSPAYSSDHAISAEFFLSWHPPGGAKEAMNADDGEGHRVEFTDHGSSWACARLPFSPFILVRHPVIHGICRSAGSLFFCPEYRHDWIASHS
jgi:hypothetical protein